MNRRYTEGSRLTFDRDPPHFIPSAGEEIFLRFKTRYTDHRLQSPHFRPDVSSEGECRILGITHSFPPFFAGYRLRVGNSQDSEGS